MQGSWTDVAVALTGGAWVTTRHPTTNLSSRFVKFTNRSAHQEAHAMQGGWTGVAVALAGGVLFTIGSMSHDRTNARQESKAPFTVAAAAIAAALFWVFYNRAVSCNYNTAVLVGRMLKHCIAAALSGESTTEHLFIVFGVWL